MYVHPLPDLTTFTRSTWVGRGRVLPLLGEKVCSLSIGSAYLWAKTVLYCSYLQMLFTTHAWKMCWSLTEFLTLTALIEGTSKYLVIMFKMKGDF